MSCEYCGKVLTLNPWEIRQRSKTITRKHCNQQCGQRAKGINPITTRYRQLKVNGKKIGEHRWVMENHLGRKLIAGEYVHHIDHDKTNNDISNLMVVNPKQHGLEHTRYPTVKTCVICGTDFTPHKTKRKIKQTCSKQCRYKLISQTYKKNRSLPKLAKLFKS
jgi:hypothetical protein